MALKLGKKRPVHPVRTGLMTGTAGLFWMLSCFHAGAEPAAIPEAQTPHPRAFSVEKIESDNWTSNLTDRRKKFHGCGVTDGTFKFDDQADTEQLIRNLINHLDTQNGMDGIYQSLRKFEESSPWWANVKLSPRLKNMTYITLRMCSRSFWYSQLIPPFKHKKDVGITFNLVDKNNEEKFKKIGSGIFVRSSYFSGPGWGIGSDKSYGLFIKYKE